MKITVSKHTSIDWDAVRKQLIERTTKAVDELIDEAKGYNFDELAEGKSAVFSTNAGKITVRRAKD